MSRMEKRGQSMDGLKNRAREWVRDAGWLSAARDRWIPISCIVRMEPSKQGTDPTL